MRWAQTQNRKRPASFDKNYVYVLTGDDRVVWARIYIEISQNLVIGISLSYKIERKIP